MITDKFGHYARLRARMAVDTVCPNVLYSLHSCGLNLDFTAHLWVCDSVGAIRFSHLHEVHIYDDDDNGPHSSANTFLNTQRCHTYADRYNDFRTDRTNANNDPSHASCMVYRSSQLHNSYSLHTGGPDCYVFCDPDCNLCKYVQNAAPTTIFAGHPVSHSKA